MIINLKLYLFTGREKKLKKALKNSPSHGITRE